MKYFLLFLSCYFLQKDGRNKINIANNSNLPSSIPKLNIHFDILGSVAKFPFGPIISPSPGPTLEIDVAAPDIDVVKSRPVIDKSPVITKKIRIYKNMNEIIEDINFWSTGFLSYFKINIPLG